MPRLAQLICGISAMLGEGLWEQVINWDLALKTLPGQGEMGFTQVWPQVLGALVGDGQHPCRSAGQQSRGRTGWKAGPPRTMVSQALWESRKRMWLAWGGAVWLASLRHLCEPCRGGGAVPEKKGWEPRCRLWGKQGTLRGRPTVHPLTTCFFSTCCVQHWPGLGMNERWEEYTGQRTNRSMAMRALCTMNHTGRLLAGKAASVAWTHRWPSAGISSTEAPGLPSRLGAGDFAGKGDGAVS